MKTTLTKEQTVEHIICVENCQHSVCVEPSVQPKFVSLILTLARNSSSSTCTPSFSPCWDTSRPMLSAPSSTRIGRIRSVIYVTQHDACCHEMRGYCSTYRVCSCVQQSKSVPTADRHVQNHWQAEMQRQHVPATMPQTGCGVLHDRTRWTRKWYQV